MGRPPDDRDAAQDLARDIAAQLSSLKGEANAHLRDPNYKTLRLRLGSSHSAIEAADAPQRGARAIGGWHSLGGPFILGFPWWLSVAIVVVFAALLW